MLKLKVDLKYYTPTYKRKERYNLINETPPAVNHTILNKYKNKKIVSDKKNYKKKTKKKMTIKRS